MTKHDGDGEEGRRIPVSDKRGFAGDEAEAAKPEGQGPGAEEAAKEAVQPPASGLDASTAELDKARAEAGEYKDKYVRLYAETENFKKRMKREGAEREKYYNEALLKELLPVIDNLDRALGHAGDAAAHDDGLVEGVRMVRKQFVDALGKFGVTPIESVGLPFDPAKQQAMMQVETDQHEDGTVVEEFQRGYFLHDRVLRPAMVTVSKKPAGPAGDSSQT